MADSSPFRVEIKPSACIDNPLVQSKMRKQRIWEFDSREEAVEWMTDLNEICENELVLNNSYLTGTIADAQIEGKESQTSWTGI